MIHRRLLCFRLPSGHKDQPSLILFLLQRAKLLELSIVVFYHYSISDFSGRKLRSQRIREDNTDFLALFIEFLKAVQYMSSIRVHKTKITHVEERQFLESYTSGAHRTIGTHILMVLVGCRESDIRCYMSMTKTKNKNH